tara:strand:+ start:67 stop:423 length:357 start_codon:yes stop_codon:yes gene_type:complete
MKAPKRARSRKKPTPFPGSPPRGRTKRGKDGIDILVPSKPKRGKGKGRGNLTMVDGTTGKRVRKGPTPFPGSPPRGRTKRGKDGIDIILPSKPKRGKGKGMKKLTSTKTVGSIKRKRK